MNGFTSRIKKTAQIFRVLLSRRNTEKSERHNIYNMYSICCRYLGHGRSVSKTIGLLCLYQPLLHTVPRMWSPPLLLISLYQHRSGVAITKHQQNGCSCRICTAEARWQNTQGASSPSKFSQNVALPTEDKLSIKYNDIIPLSIFLHTRKLSLPSDASRCGDWLYLLALVWGLLTFYFKRIAVPIAAIIFLRYCGSLSEVSLRLMIHPLTLPGTGG